jgi:parvulin-like peptidyl-prolyl isomerase
LLAAVLTNGCGGLPDDAAAKVNDVIITKENVNDRIRQITGFSPQNTPESGTDDYKKFQGGVTEQLVSEEIERQETVKRNITVPPEEIEDLLGQIVEDQYYGSIDDMNTDLAKRNVTVEDLRNDLRRRLLHQKLLDNLREEVPVSDEEVQAIYDSGKSNFVYPEKRQVRQVVLPDQASAQVVANRIAAGEQMTAIAQQVSIDATTKANGGLVGGGLVTKAQLSTAVGDVAFSLSKNQISEPFKADLGWYVLTVELIQPASNRTYDDVKEELSKFLGNQKLAQHYEEFTNSLKDIYDVEYADDYTPPPAEDTSTVSTEPGIQ